MNEHREKVIPDHSLGNNSSASSRISTMKTFLAATAGLTITLLRCLAADTNSIIGDWETDEVLSQLGPSVTAYSFRTNGTFTVSTRFTQGLMPTMGGTGTYRIVTNSTSLTNQLVKVMKGRTNVNSYYFHGSTLVIDQGRPSKVFKLKRKQ